MLPADSPVRQRRRDAHHDRRDRALTDDEGTYLAKAARDDGQVALVQSSESVYEASAYAVAQITADIVPVRS